MPSKGRVTRLPRQCGSIPDRKRTYFVSRATRPALGPNQPRIQYAAWGSRPKRKSNLSPPSTAKGETILYGLHTREFTLQQQQRLSIKPFQACSVFTGVRLCISSHVDSHFFCRLQSIHTLPGNGSIAHS
jgi:hypothetical protein